MYSMHALQTEKRTNLERQREREWKRQRQNDLYTWTKYDKFKKPLRNDIGADEV